MPVTGCAGVWWTLPRDELAKRGRETERLGGLFSRQACTWALQRFPWYRNSGFPSSGSLVHVVSDPTTWVYVGLSEASLYTDPCPHCSITVLQSMKLGIDVNRHKEIIVKSISALLLLLLKHFKLNHIYQVSSQQHFSMGLRCSSDPISQRRDARALVVLLSIFQTFLCLSRSGNPDTCCKGLGWGYGIGKDGGSEWTVSVVRP